MKKLVLLKEHNDRDDLLNKVKKDYKKLYEEIYKNQKQVIIECVVESNQKPLLDVVNKHIVVTHFDDRRFNDYHNEEIDNLIKNDLNFNNLLNEFELYSKNVKLIPNNEKMTYEEILTFKYDEDKALYEKDFSIMSKLIKTMKNLYLWGNAGNGKTTFAYKIAEEFGLPLYNINSVKNEYSVKGFFDLDGKYQKSLYEMWYEKGGILLLDEVDSYSSNGMLYLNNGIEVNSKYLTLESGETIEKNKNCYVIACANTDGSGKNSDYIGRNAIDKAFMSRFARKQYKEYAYIHKQILKDDYEEFKNFIQNELYTKLTTRMCVKLSQLLEEFDKKDIFEMIIAREIEL